MPRLLSLNVGLPRDVAWQGRTIHTGIWKTPVRGPRMVRRLNIDGDGQGDLAGHGGVNRAVYAYQIESYRYWEEQLGRHDFVYGQFGENLTVEGLSDDEVCIGDRYRIGQAVFEVSQPRVTCYRLGVRMNDARMPSLLVSHGRPGFYLRVLQEGQVQAGDAIEKIAAGSEGMTVAEIDALLYLPHRSHDQLARALRIDALSEGWQASFRELLGSDAGETGAGVPSPAWQGLRPMQVRAIQRESESVISIVLHPVDGEAADLPLAGQYLTIRLPAGTTPSPILRTYSLSGRPDPRRYRISVKREREGVASGFLHTRLRVGDVLHVGAPRGSFLLAPGNRPVVLMSAGVGATPLLAMLYDLSAERPSRPVWWMHGAPDGREHPFRGEVAELLGALPDAHRVACYSRPRADDRVGSDFDVRGRLDATVLEGAGVPVDADFYLCGPAGFMRDLGAALLARGVLPDRVKIEAFGPQDSLTPGLVNAGPVRRPHPPDGEPGAGPIVSFTRSNLSVPWRPAFRSLLELAEACDVPVRWSCRTGVCHTCETGLTGGAVSYDPDPLEPPAAGNVLICCARPAGEVLLDL